MAKSSERGDGMANEMKDETLGTIKGKIPVYQNGLDESGEIIICENGIIVRADGNTIRAPYTHVKILGKSVDMALGKVGVEMDVFDQMGEKHYYHIGMSDMHFAALQRACGK
jgi:hypothetical protein